MKQIVMGLLGGILLLTTCGQTVSVTPMPPISASETNTILKTPPAPLTSKTPREPRNEPTSTITPLPTIPTFTLTFDASTIVTVMPAPKAECPKVNTSLKPEFYVPSVPECLAKDMCVFGGTDKEILDFLNSGGSVKAVISKLRTADNGKYDTYAYRDVTGDNIPDLMFIDFGLQKQIHIFYCSTGHYEVFSLDTIPFDFDPTAWKPIIEDLNRNNLPDILFFQGAGSSCCKIFALEWDGTTFEDLSPNAYTDVPIKIEDTDKNGTQEIMGGANTETYPIGLNRFETMVFSWNGGTYELVKESSPLPTFRIQAVHDGDGATLDKDFENALNSYQKVIDDPTLESWSEARALYEQRKWESHSDLISEPTPLPDSTEYPRLATYAYYRIMLLHIVQGHESDAGTVYKTLQQKFGNDQYGQPYVEMATAFWNAYQSTHKMYDGCAAAIEYAAEHPDILMPLGSDYHGSQSHTYVPADVCPFR